MFLELLAVTSFVLTLYLLWQDRTSSAGVAVALSFGAVLFRVLPTLESFEILGLKAKLRERIEEADEVLEKVRRVASIATKAAVMNATWSNRWGGMSFDKQSSLLDEQARELAALGVTSDTIADVKRPALTMLSYDLASAFFEVIEKVTRPYSDAYGRVVGELGKVPETDKDHDHSEKLAAAKAAQSSYSFSRYRSVLEKVTERPEALESLMNEATSLYRWSAEDRKRLEALAKKMSAINSKVWSTGRMDEEAGKLLEKRGGDALFKEAFPNGPSGPDWNVYDDTQ